MDRTSAIILLIPLVLMSCGTAATQAVPTPQAIPYVLRATPQIEPTSRVSTLILETVTDWTCITSPIGDYTVPVPTAWPFRTTSMDGLVSKISADKQAAMMVQYAAALNSRPAILMPSRPPLPYPIMHNHSFNNPLQQQQARERFLRFSVTHHQHKICTGLSSMPSFPSEITFSSYG